MASDTIKEAMGLVNKRSVTDHVDGRRMREFNRTWRKEKFIVCTYVLVGTDLTTKLIANKPCFSSKVTCHKQIRPVAAEVVAATTHQHTHLAPAP